MLLKMIPKRFLVSALSCALILWTSGCRPQRRKTPKCNATGSPAGAGDSGTVAATGSADRVVSRRTGRGSSGRSHLSD